MNKTIARVMAVVALLAMGGCEKVERRKQGDGAATVTKTDTTTTVIFNQNHSRYLSLSVYGREGSTHPVFAWSASEEVINVTVICHESRSINFANDIFVREAANSRTSGTIKVSLLPNMYYYCYFQATLKSAGTMVISSPKGIRTGFGP